MEKGYYRSRAKGNPKRCSVAIHNKNGKGLLHILYIVHGIISNVAIHNKNGKGLLRILAVEANKLDAVAIHNKNGKGLLLQNLFLYKKLTLLSQSTIKMEKGYYSFLKGGYLSRPNRRNPQ